MVPGKLRVLISDDHGRPHPQLLGVEAYLLRNQDNAEAVLSFDDVPSAWAGWAP